jgi:hypothetical protein
MPRDASAARAADAVPRTTRGDAVAATPRRDAAPRRDVSFAADDDGDVYYCVINYYRCE